MPAEVAPIIEEDHEGELLCEESQQRYPEDEVMHCSRTEANYHQDHMVYVTDIDEYVYRERADSHCYNCEIDSERYYEDGVQMYNGDMVNRENLYGDGGFCCQSCLDYFYEHNYGGDDMCEDCYRDSDNDDGQHAPQYVSDGSYVPTQVQEERSDMSDRIISMLNSHYNNGYGRDNRGYIKDIEMSGTLSLMKDNTPVYVSALFRKNNKLGPYVSVTRVDEAKGPAMSVNLTVIDMFGRKKTRTEPIKNIENYYKRIGRPIEDLGYTCTKQDVSFHWILSNDQEDMADIENQVFSTCQSNGEDQYSKGYADLFTNGGNSLLLLRKEDSDSVLGRAVCRLFYDSAGVEYIMMDRLYLTGDLANQYKTVFAMIVNELKTKCNLVVSGYSMHDRSGKYYCEESGIKVEQIGKTLRQPKRKFLHRERHYYSDSGVITYEHGSYYYDCLKKRNAFLVSKE